jgi:hypothetical protein
MVDICSNDDSDDNRAPVELERALVIVASISVKNVVFSSDNDRLVEVSMPDFSLLVVRSTWVGV